MKTYILLSTTIVGAMLTNLIPAVPAHAWQPVGDITKIANPVNQTAAPPSVEQFNADGMSISTSKSQFNPNFPNPSSYEVQQRNSRVADKLSNQSPEYNEGFAGAQTIQTNTQYNQTYGKSGSKTSKSTGTNAPGWERPYSQIYGGKRITPRRDPNEGTRNAEVWNRDYMR